MIGSFRFRKVTPMQRGRFSIRRATVPKFLAEQGKAQVMQVSVCL